MTSLEFDIGVILTACVFHAWVSNGERNYALNYRMRLNKDFTGYTVLLLYKIGVTLTTWLLGFMCVTVGVKYALHSRQLHVY